MSTIPTTTTTTTPEARVRDRLRLLEDERIRPWLEEAGERQLYAEIAAQLGVNYGWAQSASDGAHQPYIGDAPCLDAYIARLRAAIVANIRADQARNTAERRAHTAALRVRRRKALKARWWSAPPRPARVQPTRGTRKE
jgi:hypothetical protein